MIRSGALAAGARLPSTRALAGDLGVSRRLVVEAYAQLLAEGYLVARQGDGTYVTSRPAGGASPERAAEPPAQVQFDFFPGTPDLSAFPRKLWLASMREALTSLPDRGLGYPDPRGEPALRSALASYLRRVRGVEASPERIVVFAGTTQALALVGSVLHHRGARLAAVEDPGMPLHRAILRRARLRCAGVPVDASGLDPRVLGDASVVLCTPAHQFPLGAVLAPARRTVLLDWARAGERWVIEDDYDAEFRYDRAPVGSLQGLEPERVVYIGTASKTLAPALRLAWAVLPAELLGAVAEAKMLTDGGCPALEQAALARMIETASYDRHLRVVRRSNRTRRDALLAALAKHLPGAEVSGVSAGVQVLATLPAPRPAAALVAACRRRSVAVYPDNLFRLRATPAARALVLGYANLAPAAIAEGVRRLGAALAEVS